MIFKLDTAGLHYAEHVEIENLKQLGFSFVLGDYEGTFKISGTPDVEINSIEELLAFVKKTKSAVIVNGDDSLTIYDNYLE